MGMIKPKLVPRNSGGFSLIELMIAMAVIGVLATVGLPAYRGYIETTNMGKVNNAYQSAVRAVQNEFAKDAAKLSLGFDSGLPDDEAGWINLFDSSGKNLAPGGGPIFVDDSVTDDPDETGAITISYDASIKQVRIIRPAYISLLPFTAVISRGSLDITQASL